MGAASPGGRRRTALLTSSSPDSPASAREPGQEFYPPLAPRRRVRPRHGCACRLPVAAARVPSGAAEPEEGPSRQGHYLSRGQQPLCSRGAPARWCSTAAGVLLQETDTPALGLRWPGRSETVCSSVKWGLCSPAPVCKDQKVSGREDSHKRNAALLSVPLLPVMTVEQKPGLILTGVSHTCRMWPVCPCLRTQAFLQL